MKYYIVIGEAQVESMSSPGFPDLLKISAKEDSWHTPPSHNHKWIEQNEWHDFVQKLNLQDFFFADHFKPRGI